MKKKSKVGIVIKLLKLNKKGIKKKSVIKFEEILNLLLVKIFIEKKLKILCNSLVLLLEIFKLL